MRAGPLPVTPRSVAGILPDVASNPIFPMTMSPYRRGAWLHVKPDGSTELASAMQAHQRCVGVGRCFIFRI